MIKKMRGILLLGPTGAGKTPLGDYLEKHGLWNSRCFHFDFGEMLRKAIGKEGEAWGITGDEADFLKQVLFSGALLENEHFLLAEKIFRGFAAVKKAGAEDIIIFNGLPRHVHQAKSVGLLVSMELVVHLSCTPRVVYKRIRSNAGGDRSGRTDDGETAIKNKLEIFTKRTAPLVAFYRARGITVIEPVVQIETRPENIYALISRRSAP